MNNKPEDELLSELNQEDTLESEYIQKDFTEDASYDMEEPYQVVEEAAKPEVTGKKTKGIIYDLIFYAALIFVCVYILPNFVLQRTIVDGPSMEDTLHDKEQLYVEKLSYRFNALDRFDIIVFYPYGREDKDEYYVKRIIGLPGETVKIVGNNIYIDEVLLEEDYGKEPIDNPGRAGTPIKLGEDEYFVLGDNRNNSLDSRSERVGNIKKVNIGGRVILRILPLKKFGLVD